MAENRIFAIEPTNVFLQKHFHNLSLEHFLHVQSF